MQRSLERFSGGSVPEEPDNLALIDKWDTSSTSLHPAALSSFRSGSDWILTFSLLRVLYLLRPHVSHTR